MGNGLKILRSANKWTLDQAADRMSMSRGGYIKLERGENQLTEETIARAATVFRTSPLIVLGHGASTAMLVAWPCGILSGIGNNLRNLRKQKGWTHEQAADAMGVSRSQFIKLERGERRLYPEYIESAARAFGVSGQQIISLSNNSIPVVGLVSAGGAIDTGWENHHDPLFEIELPFPVGDDAIGFAISGESMLPKYDPGDVIVVSRTGEPPESLVGLEAVVRAGKDDENGGRYFKRLIRGGTPGLYDLESYNAHPMRGVEIAWASGLIARVPASRWRKINGKVLKQAVKKVAISKGKKG